MTRKEQRVAHAMSFEGKDIESEGLKEIVRLATYEGSIWADKTMIDKACDWLGTNLLTYIEYCKNGTGESVTEFVGDFRKAMEG